MNVTTIYTYIVRTCYLLKGNYEEAIEKTLESLQLLAIDTDVFYKIMALNLAGIIYGACGDEVTSINYMLKAYYVSLEEHEISYLHIILNNLGVLFMNLKFYDIAMEYFLQSFEKRDISIHKPININDGVNIINLLGCCVHLHKDEEYQKWETYYQTFHMMYTDPIVECDYAMYQVFRSFYNKGEDIYGKLDVFFEKAAKNKDWLHIMKDEIQLFDLCIKLENKEYCEKMLQDITVVIQRETNYRKASILNDLKVKFYKTFAMQDQFQQELMIYYENQEKEKIEKDQIMKQILLTKTELENTLFHQAKIVKKNEELRKNIELEEFTMLLNKSSFKKYVVQELEHMHSDQYICLFLIDIDNFKEVNDSYGHLYGDEILLQVADVLKKTSRASDYIGRIGGDEFCIFMKNVLSLNYLDEAASQLTQKINQIQLKEDGHVSASIGVCATNKKITYDEMFRCADENMYEAKHLKNRDYMIKLIGEEK